MDVEIGEAVDDLRPRVAAVLAPEDAVDLDRAGQKRTPGLQIGLHPRVAGDPLPVELKDFVSLILDLVDEAAGIIHVLQKPHPAPAERLIERSGGPQKRGDVRRVRRWKRKLELNGSPHRLRLCCHSSRPIAKASRRLALRPGC